ncbi:MAG: VWA domain-containing protein [Phycisphaerales bacterium]|nr:VWA domain-containing protein [Phycisphaerales bacterium]
MSLGFERPEWLWGLLLALPAAWVGFRWLTAMAPVRRVSAVLARSGLIALIIGMLAGVSVVRTSDRVAVVAVVDVSGSVRRFGAGTYDAVRAFLAGAERARGPDDLIGLVTFDAHARAVASPTRGDIADRGLNAGAAEGTDIESALRYAATMLPPDAAGRLVLVSDGVQTSGDAERGASGASRPGAARAIPIDVVPIRYEVTGETSVVSVDAPPRAAAESTVNVRVVLDSTAGSTGRLFLTREGEPVDINGDEPGVARRLVLGPGPHVEVVSVPLPDGRIHRFRAVYEPDTGGVPPAPVGDAIAENNSAGAVTATPGRGSVLILSRDGSSGLAGALNESGILTTVLPPAGAPGDLLSIQAYDTIILDNIPADDLRPEQQDVLSAFVRELGGGLVMIGGTESFGAGGWKGSSLEPLLPVRLDLPEKLIEPDAAIVLVLDVSGSMNRPVGGTGRTQQEVANEAAARAVQSLPARDLVGVIAFSDSYHVVVPLAPNSDAAGTAGRIRALSPMGGTSIGPALTEAGRQLLPATASVRHVVVVSDGQSMGEDELPGIAQRLAARGVRVSTISVGDEADDRTMEAMAIRGEGTFYPVSNPALLPRFFLKAVRVVRSPLVREGPFDPVVLPDPSPLTAGLGTPPPLLGLNLTQWRPEPTIVHAMQAPGGEPLLAHWQVELGQVAAFTSDAGRWAADWRGWPGFQRLWTQVVRSVARAPASGRMDLTAEAAGDELRIHLEASADDGTPLDLLAVPVSVYGPDGQAQSIRLTEAAPGLYEGRIAARESGSYVAVAKPMAGARRLAPVLAGATVASGVEFRALKSDEPLLRSIASASGGRVLELSDPLAPGRLFERDGSERALARTPLWRSLLLWTLGVLMLDLGTRRIAWDRFIRSRPGPAGAAAGPRARAMLSGRLKRVVPEAGPVLTDEDARRVVARERERRMQQRLAALRSMREPDAPPPATGPAEPQGTEGLLEAKRRARERFDGDGAP